MEDIQVTNNAPANEPSEEDLTVREAKSRVKKLELELRLLDRQLSPWFTRLELIKSLASIAGVLTAIVALAAFFWSVWNGLEQLNLARQGRNQERFNAAIKLIGDANENQRWTGVLSLQEFLTSEHPDYQRRVILVLTNQLANESSPSVRKIIVDIISQIDGKALGTNVLNEAVKSLADSSRTLMSDGNIKRAILRSPNFNLPSEPEQAARAKSVGDAIAALIRQGVTERDLSGIFCFKCDFKNAELSKGKFDQSVLSFADFSGARLDGASFTEALLENTKFISTSLRDANFQGPVKNEGLLGVVEWTDDEFYALHRYLTNGPLFNCADLKGASFNGRVIFTFISDEDDRAGSPYWFASFVRANLEQTDLRRAVLIGLDKGKEVAIPFEGVSSRTGGWPVVDQIKNLLNKKRRPSDLPELDINERVFRIKLNQSAKLSPSKNRYVTSFRLMEMAFAGSNWQSASLPQGMVDYLNSPIEKGSFVARYPAALFDDGCQPTRH